MGNLSAELHLNDFTTDEFTALLASVFNHHVWDPSDPHTVIWGDDALRLTFKSGERRILHVKSGPRLSNDTMTQLKHLVASALARGGREVVASIAAFQWGPSPPPLLCWRNEWQLTLLPDEAPRPDEELALFPFLFQYTHKEVGLPWLDAVRRARRFRETFLPLVPLLAQQGIMLVEPIGTSARKTWALHLLDGELRTLWGTCGYALPSLPTDGFYRHPSVHVDTWGVDAVPQPNFYHDHIRPHMEPRLLDYANLNAQNRERYLTGCHWYHRGATASTQTEAYLAMIVMVESFLPKDSKVCNTCGQPAFSISKRFQAFLRQYAGPSEAQGQAQHDEFQKIASELYTLRSAIAHSGRTVGAEGLGFSAGIVPIDLIDRDRVLQLRELGARVLLRWLADQNRQAND